MADHKNAGRKVLVVEDDAAICELFQTVLPGKGYDVKIASGYADAVKQLQDQHYDAVVTDGKLMGSDKGGLDLIQEIRNGQFGEGNKHSFIVMQTGDAAPEFKSKALQAGADGFLIKPEIMKPLLAALKGRFTSLDGVIEPGRTQVQSPLPQKKEIQ